jgi:hypothetical protein
MTVPHQDCLSTNQIYIESNCRALAKYIMHHTPELVLLDGSRTVETIAIKGMSTDKIHETLRAKGFRQKAIWSALGGGGGDGGDGEGGGLRGSRAKAALERARAAVAAGAE